MCWICEVRRDYAALAATPEAPPPPPAGFASDDEAAAAEDDVLELEEVVEEDLGPPIDLGPPLLTEEVADSSRHRLEELASVAAAAPTRRLPPGSSSPYMT